jgi:cbb3-type cytochrome oxidase subunit 1
MITAWIVISYIVGLAAVIDQVRRPASEWASADRNRSWWIGTTAVAAFFACGVFAALAYFIGVLPRFGQRDGIDEGFREKR